MTTFLANLPISLATLTALSATLSVFLVESTKHARG